MCLSNYFRTVINCYCHKYCSQLLHQLQLSPTNKCFRTIKLTKWTKLKHIDHVNCHQSPNGPQTYIDLCFREVLSTTINSEEIGVRHLQCTCLNRKHCVMQRDLQSADVKCILHQLREQMLTQCCTELLFRAKRNKIQRHTQLRMSQNANGFYSTCRLCNQTNI